MPTPVLSLRKIFTTWWPLAASWLLMGAEMPALSAIVARLPDPEIHLAAYGGVVFPLALIIESPIIMLLAASTALSKDLASYRLVRRFMMIASALLTALHALVAFTPLYDLVVEGILGVPAEIVEPARWGLMIMLPWTWSIAYRRFHQGVLIRFGRSRAVTAGTFIRLGCDLLVLVLGYTVREIPGIIVATSGVALGVMGEAIYVGIVVRPVLKGSLREAAPVRPALNYRAFFTFYIPLVLTSLLTLVAQPIGSAALSRMPLALESLAIWPVITGLAFLLRSTGIAFNEVVVALLDEPRSSHSLRRFAAWLSLGSSLVLLVIAATPLAGLWFGRLSALASPLADLAARAVWLAVPMPALNVYQSWYQGAILHSRHTQAISEAVVVFLLTSAIVLGIGVAWGQEPGLYFGMAALLFSLLTQTAWLGWRARPALQAIQDRDAAQASLTST
jgi:hypothetical protein